jgi:transposase
MVPARYSEVMSKVKDKFWWRQKMVRYAQEYGLSAAALEFGTTRKTVRLWLYRYRKEGVKGLVGRSRAPKRIPHKTFSELEIKVVRLKCRYFTLSASRLKEFFDLPLSVGAMYRIFSEHGLTKRKKKYQRRRDLREVKRRLKVFEVIQMDTKQLDDIEELYPAYFRYKLPKYQFTARDLRTGGVWMAYAQECSLTNAVWFLKLLALHLSWCGVDLKKVRIQTDNGSEFVGSWQSKDVSEFVRLVEKNWREHFPIPPGAKTYNSDVEAFHGRVEQEFYRIEHIRSKDQFFGKAKAYLRWFNYHRMNHYKEGIPIQLLSDLIGNQYRPEIFDLDPVLLDNYTRSPTGYNVPVKHNSQQFL